MKIALIPALAIGLSALGFVAPAAAQHAPQHAQVPPAEVIDGVTVINGGADVDEARAIKRIANQYPVSLEISGRGGAYYVADALAVVQKGRLVTEVLDAGPLLLMDLQPGRYELIASFDGTIVKRDLQVNREGSTVHWVVPSSID